MRIELGAAEDDAIDVWIVIDNTLQCSILVLGMDEVIDMIDVSRSCILMSNCDLDGIVEIFFSDFGNGLWHCCTEEHSAMIFWHTA